MGRIQLGHLMGTVNMRSALAATWALIALMGCGGGDGNPNPAAPPPSSPSVITDAQLRALATASAGWTHYKNRPIDTLPRAGGSGHAESRLLTRFNAVAATQLDGAGKVRTAASFPDSSLIVKELYTGSVITTLAVMMKLRGSPNASAGGWVWGYFDGAGNVRIAAANRGAACAGCHSVGIDYTRMNDSHP